MTFPGVYFQTLTGRNYDCDIVILVMEFARSHELKIAFYFAEDSFNAEPIAERNEISVRPSGKL